MLLRGDEVGAFVKDHLGLGSGEDAVDLFAVDADGGDTHMGVQLVEAFQYIVKANSLSCILFKTYDGKTVVIQYVADERHRYSSFLKEARNFFQ